MFLKIFLSLLGRNVFLDCGVSFVSILLQIPHLLIYLFQFVYKVKCLKICRLQVEQWPVEQMHTELL